LLNFIKKKIFSNALMWVMLSNHKHYNLTNIYYTFTQAHMEFLADHIYHLNDPGRTGNPPRRFFYQRFSCEYVCGLKSCQHKSWQVGIRYIMVKKSIRLNYIASVIVNGIKSKIHNKTNAIICIWYVACAHFGHYRNALYISTLRRFYDHLSFKRG